MLMSRTLSLARIDPFALWSPHCSRPAACLLCLSLIRAVGDYYVYFAGTEESTHDLGPASAFAPAGQGQGQERARVRARRAVRGGRDYTGVGADIADTEMRDFSEVNPMHARPTAAAAAAPGIPLGIPLRGERQPSPWVTLYAATAHAAGAAWTQAGAAAAAGWQASLGVIEQAADVVGRPVALTTASQQAGTVTGTFEGYRGVPQGSTHGGAGMVPGEGGGGGGETETGHYVPPTLDPDSADTKGQPHGEQTHTA